MKETEDAGKYQVDNDGLVQGQVIGDYATVYQYFHSGKDRKKILPPKPRKNRILFTLAFTIIVMMLSTASSLGLGTAVQVDIWPTKIPQVLIFAEVDDSSKIIGYIDSHGSINVYCQREGKFMVYKDEKIKNKRNFSFWWSETRTSNGTLGWISNVYIEGLAKLPNVPVCSSSQT